MIFHRSQAPASWRWRNHESRRYCRHSWNHFQRYPPQAIIPKKFYSQKTHAECQPLRFNSSNMETYSIPFSVDELLDALSNSGDCSLLGWYYLMLKHLPSKILDTLWIPSVSCGSLVTFQTFQLLDAIHTLFPYQSWQRYNRCGVVICLERGANDLHMVQLMPLPPHHLLVH